MSPTPHTPARRSRIPDYDVVVVGAGFGGLYALHRFRSMGLRTVVFEAGTGVGGTWFWNRYPGAKCDVESLDYSYSFSPELEQEWHWTSRYASQPEILQYIEHVADRFDLRRDIRFSTRVTAARFDESSGAWTVTTEHAGLAEEVSARFCVMATGCLSVGKLPEIPGITSFSGTTLHTSSWPPEGADFSGHRVGIIGTGSSAIQAIPLIAEHAEHLFVFQRTPNFSLPAHDGPLDPETESERKAHYREHRALARKAGNGVPVETPRYNALEVTDSERRAMYEARWTKGGIAFLSTFRDILTNDAANETAAEFVREKIRSIVHDPTVAELLCPHTYPIGAKRTCLDTGYYETFNRPNVSLVDVRSAPITEITEHGLRTTDGDYEFDVLVLATGFDAMTGALTSIDIRGREDRSLREEWSTGARTYLGLMVAGFPNLFTLTGPGSPSVLSNMVLAVEQHVDWIAACLEHLEQEGHHTVEATEDAQTAWVHQVNSIADATLYPKADSWYVGANVPGKPRVFLPYVGGVGRYRETCDRVVANGYEGFAFG